MQIEKCKLQIAELHSRLALRSISPHRLRLSAALAVASALAAAAAAANAPPLGNLLHIPDDVYSATRTRPEHVDRAAASQALASAKQAVAAGQVSDALRHAARALAFDPDLEEARRLLGYRRFGDQWAGVYAARMLGGGHAWDARFGWVKADHLAKYAAGRRPLGGQWITAEEDARRHARIERGWALRSDHFLVQTNVSRAAGVELAMRLESIYQAWRQLFGEFDLSVEELQRRVAGEEPREPSRAFRVFYHRDRQEYVDALRARQPQIAVTLGIYFDDERESHFFAGEDQDPGTIAHETVHQLFYETTLRPTRALGVAGNMWAIEGVACYFESLVELPRDERSGRRFLVGHALLGRLPAARQRRLVDGFYVPLGELSKLGIDALQQRSDLPQLYSQSAGLAAFFVDGDGGKRREAFRRTLAAIYVGQDDAATLEKESGEAYAALDESYAEFLRGLPTGATPAAGSTGGGSR